jgi:hypothetical protein
MKTPAFILSVVLACMAALPALSQENESNTPRDITVKIIDKKSRPVSNVALQTADGQQKGMTLKDGQYVFVNLTDNDSIVLVLPKFGITTLAVANMDSIVVKLNSASKYSYMAADGRSVEVKQLNTQSSTVLDVEKLLERSNYSCLSDLLRGKVAGLNLSADATTGEVSSTIRGSRSFLGSNEPLVVLNGAAIGTLSVADTIIDIYAVKTVEVLKNASEWGSRGANGVILVVTK